MSDRPPPLDYAEPRPREPSPARGIVWSGAAMSLGPVGCLVAFIAGPIISRHNRGGPIPGQPYPDGGFGAFFAGALVWVAVAFVGIVVSVVIGVIAHRRRGRHH